MNEKQEINEFIGVIFVTSGTRGDRLLFKYPFESEDKKLSTTKSSGQNPYAIKIAEDFRLNKDEKGQISTNPGGLSDGILAKMLVVRSQILCEHNFDLKIGEIRFVGFPLLLDYSQKTSHQIHIFNIVFVLQASANAYVVSYYHDLAKQITVSLKHEEKRCQYLSTQAKIMTTLHDHAADSMVSPFESILQQSQLAKHLRIIYDSLRSEGYVHLYINNWIEINFCLPHKVHGLQGHRLFASEPESIQKCLKSLRPYHGLLLLQEESALLESLPVDCTPALSRLIQVTNPLHSLQLLALDADLSLFQVFQLVCHLVFWAKATIIYPLCETNVYILSPTANTQVSSSLAEAFVQQFPGRSLPVELSEFSFPTQLRDTQHVLNQQANQDLKVNMVVWMLQRYLLIQLHTYIYFVPPVKRRRKKISDEMTRMPVVSEEWGFLDGIQRSPSFSDAASVTSEDSVTLSTPGLLVAQLSKSPSTEFMTDSGLGSEENKLYWMMQESVFANLSIEEKECITNVSAAKNLEDLKMFIRLFPYFCGKNHLEEIMYFENLRRSQLLTLIDKFREVLILCSYQDPATVFSDNLR